MQSALPQAGFTRLEADALTPQDFRLLTWLLGPVLSTHPGSSYDSRSRTW